MSPSRQEEDNSTYNFRWYTSYACPEEPLECLVTDPLSMEQYDLSRCGAAALGLAPAGPVSAEVSHVGLVGAWS